MPYPILLLELPPTVELRSVNRLPAPVITLAPESESSEDKETRSQISPVNSGETANSFLDSIAPPIIFPSVLIPTEHLPEPPQAVLQTTELLESSNDQRRQGRGIPFSTSEAIVERQARLSESDTLLPSSPLLNPNSLQQEITREDNAVRQSDNRAVQSHAVQPNAAQSVIPRSASEQPSVLSEALPADYLAQTGPSSDPLSTGSDTSDEASDPAAIIYPEAATPEPFWSNGAITNSGQLLPPSQPTNRPEVPFDLTADYQAYEPVRQIVTARGNVTLTLNNGLLKADRLWANLFNRYVLVEGNVIFQQGEQTFRAERGEYNLLQGQGRLFDANGTLFLPDLGSDLASIFPEDAVLEDGPGVLPPEGPIGGVRSTGSIVFGTSVSGGLETLPADPTAGGSVGRIRFEAAQVDFDAEGWVASEVRLTNDPFSPPELELRGDTARLTRLTELTDELYIENARLVFDQGFTLPLLRSRLLLSREETDSLVPVSIGFDGEDRDGLFIERTFKVEAVAPWDLRITPQLLVQRFVEDQEAETLSNFGLEIDLDGRLGPTTKFSSNASFSGLDLDNFEDRLRSRVAIEQTLGNHRLNLQHVYRERLFNGSLGFREVQSSIGAVLLSPNITLGNTGVVMSYQASAQFVRADTDRSDLLDSLESEDLVSLGRFQGSIALNRGFTLWRGKPLPPTREAGLRFTPRPVVPNLRLILGARGTYSYYTSQDTQALLSAIVGIRGEIGHFSRDYFDSTVFNLSYRRSLSVGEGESPFLFDRDVDQNVLSGGIIQQIYGPIRIGLQTSVNLDTGEFISTDYILEYSRRTYGILLRFNPNRASGFIGLRLSDFDWSGRAARFGGADIRDVEGGVVR